MCLLQVQCGMGKLGVLLISCGFEGEALIGQGHQQGTLSVNSTDNASGIFFFASPFQQPGCNSGPCLLAQIITIASLNGRSGASFYRSSCTSQDSRTQGVGGKSG